MAGTRPTKPVLRAGFLVVAAALILSTVACGSSRPVTTPPPATEPDSTTTTSTAPDTTTTSPFSGLWPGSLFTSGRVAYWPVNAQSAVFAHDIVSDYKADYGAVGVVQIPIYIVPASQPTVTVSVEAGCNNFIPSTGAQVPIPSYAQLTGTSDSPLVVFQPSTGADWELWKVAKQSDSSYWACWGGEMDARRSSGVFPWPYGESATGISYLATAITEQDIASGSIDHALALQIPECNGDTYPADRGDCGDNPGQPPEGQWFRLPANLALPAGLTPFARMVFVALQKYGAVVTDQAGAVNIVAEQSSDWAAEGYKGLDPITNSWQGLLEYQVIADLPWGQLQAVDPPAS